MNKNDAVGAGLMLLAIGTFIPVWRSGARKNLSFWSFVLNHTIWGPPIEYIPDEDYARALDNPFREVK